MAQLGLLSGARSWTRRRRSGKCGLLKGGGVRTCWDEKRLELSGWSLEAEVGRQDLEQLHRQEERGGLKGDFARIIRFAKNLLRHWTFPICFYLDFLHCSYNMWSGAMMPFCGEILTQDFCLQLVVTCIGKLLNHLRLQCMLILRSQSHSYISWYWQHIPLSDYLIRPSRRGVHAFKKTAFVTITNSQMQKRKSNKIR